MPNMIDHHCDLLYALTTPTTPILRCDVEQIIAGGVTHQVFAIFTPTETTSAEQGLKQAALYHELPSLYPGRVKFLDQPEISAPLTASLAIENASSFCSESEPLGEGLKRFDSILADAKLIRYLSLTWAGENRFGGGNGSSVGLKADGRELLRHLSGRKVPIDFSHTSDALADDILETMDRENLDLPVMASHSNFRGIADHERNLPDRIASEIVRRDGIIALNVIKPFIGELIDFIEHVQYGATILGASQSLACGFDYFETPPEMSESYFFPDWADASAAKIITDLIESYSAPLAKAMKWENSQRFYTRIHGREMV